MNKDEKIIELINRLVEKIVQEYKPEKIVLFGSYAYGNPDSHSDLDFLIIKETKDRPIDRRVMVSQIVDDRKLNIPVEPLVFTPDELKDRLKIKDQFIEQILDHGEVLYER